VLLSFHTWSFGAAPRPPLPLNDFEIETFPFPARDRGLSPFPVFLGRVIVTPPVLAEAGAAFSPSTPIREALLFFHFVPDHAPALSNLRLQLLSLERHDGALFFLLLRCCFYFALFMQGSPSFPVRGRTRSQLIRKPFLFFFYPPSRICELFVVFGDLQTQPFLVHTFGLILPISSILLLPCQRTSSLP